jgi:proline dehydrogenase
MDYNNTEIAFQDKDNRSLRKAYWLFRMLARPALVKTGSSLLRVALWMRLPVKWALKPTVFDHFCGGETIEECETTIRKLGASRVQTILDYSAEGGEREADLDHTMSQILATIDKAAEDKHIPYAVFKPTGVARFGLLEKVQSAESLNDSEKAEFEKANKRFETICAYAAGKDVPVMIDSEESWIQDVVDSLVEELMLKFNKSKPLIFNTVQMYRHDRLNYMKRFIERARDTGVFSAFKLVRGAYMEKERERALEMGYASPIHPDKNATDKAFNDATLLCLNSINDVAVCIGTHNEESCTVGVNQISAMGLPVSHPHISFAQLLGMSDHISYNLAASGFNVCKYVPYGPVKTVIPYLIRRAEENTSVAGQTSRELYLLRKELQRRRS